MKVRINGETKVISIKTDSTNERSEYYRFGISYGNDNETSTIHIPKKSLDAISVDNLSLSFGAAGSTQLGIMSIDRLII